MSAPTHPTDRPHLELLSDPTRRRICSILSNPDPPVAERDLAIELATRFLDRPAVDITAEQRRQQQIQLRHHQLPKLADYGLVTYDRATRTVSITPAGERTLAAYAGWQQQSPATVSATSD